MSLSGAARWHIGGVLTAVVFLMPSCSTGRSQVVRGHPFDHMIFVGRSHITGPRLHVYVEGDGNPWLLRGRVAANPTSRRLVALELMRHDHTPALLLGRPCYHGVRDSKCEPLLWTHRRYSPEVVGSMELALRRYLQSKPDVRLVFIGHSGGGTLAVLLARRFANAAGVVTLAGNLDIAQWAGIHDFTPLTGSLNPADEGPLPRSMFQLHLAGDRDRSVPAEEMRDAASILGGRLEVVSGDHDCCWRTVWPIMLRRIQELMSQAPSRRE